MTVRAALAEGTGALTAGSPGSPFLDAALLLAQCLCVDRDRLLSMLPDDVPDGAISEYRALVRRRLAGEPVAYLLGRKEFYGRVFKVDERVLVPRPDTETLVEAVLARLPLPDRKGRGAVRYHDAFAGSGCVGISVAAERPDVELSMSDASEDALAVCEENAKLLLPSMPDIRRGSSLSAAAGAFDAISANPPYVTSSLTDEILGAGGHEPRLALDGGIEGLDLYASLAREAFARLRPGGWLCVEIGEEQGASVSAMLRAAGFSNVELLRDMAGHDRVAAGVKHAV